MDDSRSKPTFTWSQSGGSCVFIANFEQISDIVQVFAVLNLNK